VLLLILTVPSNLYASDSPGQPAASPKPVHEHLLAASLVHHIRAPMRVHQRSGLLIDADVRLRAAEALSSNPAGFVMVQRVHADHLASR
jgi:hypothetical protein